jgi:hypothetical protein
MLIKRNERREECCEEGLSVLSGMDSFWENRLRILERIESIEESDAFCDVMIRECLRESCFIKVED